MQIESKKDVALVRRAAREGWNTEQSVRAKLVESLLDYLNADPTAAVDVTKTFIEMDKADIARHEMEIKRELVELKKLGDENAIKLRLLEIAERVPATELAELASRNGLIGDGGQ